MKTVNDFWRSRQRDDYSEATVAMACAACFGKSDSPMAQGMNAGIYALLGVIGTVLCGAATFFVFLARRASAVAKTQEGSQTR